MSLTNAQMVRRWRLNTRAALLREFGNQCEFCHVPNMGYNLEFAHIQPNGFNGMGRGSNNRLCDIMQHKGSYVLLCHLCHQDFDNDRIHPARYMRYVYGVGIAEITIDGTTHHPSEGRCIECFGLEFPKVHKGCGGLVHSQFGDENSDCDYWLYYKCDKCGQESFTDDDYVKES